MKKGVCKHYNGTGLGPKNLVGGKHCCEVGVCIRDLVGGPDFGWAVRTPCFKDHKTDVACDKYEEPTAKELSAYKAETRRLLKRMELTFPLIEKVKRENKGKDATGIVECPVCKGRLCWSHAAYNGHVWGRCETKDCLAWME